MRKIKSTPLKEADHKIKGLYVKELAAIEPTSLKTPILMVHGACHGWWAYAKWLPFFAACGWTAYSMSLRNHAGSYKVPDETYLQLTVDDYAEDVLEVLSWIDRPVVLIGHSMGGITAQRVAERASLKALILLAAVGPGQLGPIRDPLPSDQTFMFTPDQAKEIWFHNIDAASFNSIYDQLVPESVSVVNHYSSAQIWIDRSKIRCPILTIGAEYDRTAVHNFQSIAKFYKSDCLLVPNAGHDFMLEPSALDVAIRINYWLLSILPGWGLQPFKTFAGS